MNRQTSVLLIHVLGYLSFLALPYLFADDGLTKLAELPNNAHERCNLASYLLAIVFYERIAADRGNNY